MPQVTANRSAWILILLVALCARLAVGLWWQSRLGDRQFFFGDSAGYWELARTIAAGEPYQYLTADSRVFRTPGYPVLLSSIFLVFGQQPPVIAARVLSAVLGTAAVAITGWWATRLFDARAGRVAGWITALYPGSVALGVFVLSEAPFCPLMIGHLGLWGAAWQSPSLKRALGLALFAGIVAAGATLMRPSWLLFTPFALLAGLVFVHDRRRHLLIGAAMCLAICAGMLPWWIHNARVTGRFIPTTLQVGASLYDGLHPGATGASDMQFVPEMVALERAAPVADGADVFEYRVDRRMWNASVHWARENPGRALQLVGIKFLRMWNVWPNEPAFRGWAVRLVLLATYVPLMLLGLIGVWRFTSRGWPYVLTWLPAVYLTLLHVVFVSSLRYREPAMISLAVLAAGVIVGATRSAATQATVAVEP